MVREQRRFTKEFEEKAACLVTISGRTQREIAEDIDLLTLPCWLERQREADYWRNPSMDEESDAELKRLGRKNYILRVERDSFKKSAAFP